MGFSVCAGPGGIDLYYRYTLTIIFQIDEQFKKNEIELREPEGFQICTGSTRQMLMDCENECNIQPRYGSQ